MYDLFFSDIAVDLLIWAYQENNRVKASKLMRAACRIEQKFRVLQVGCYPRSLKTIKGIALMHPPPGRIIREGETP